MRIAMDYYKVVGVVEPESASPGSGPAAANGANADDYAPRIYIPLTAAKSRFGETLVRRSQGTFEAERVELHEAIIQVAHLEDVEETAMVIEDILSRQRRTKDYEMIVPLELLRQAERTKQIFNTVLGRYCRHFPVGGRHRHHEHYAGECYRAHPRNRHPAGARCEKRDIVVQFLIETVILSGTGDSSG